MSLRDIDASSLITVTAPDGVTYFDANGVLQTAPPDTYVKDHKFNPATGLWEPRGMPVFPALENLCPHRNPGLWGSGTAASVANRVGIDGVADSAYTLTDDSDASIESRFFDLAVAEDTASHVFLFRIAKDVAPATYPGISVNFFAGTNINYAYTVSPLDGSVALRSAPGVAAAQDVILIDEGAWWRIGLVCANNGVGSNVVRVAVFPAVNTDGGATWVSSAQGGAGFDQCDVFLNCTYAPPTIITNGTPVTRSNIDLIIPDITKIATPDNFAVGIEIEVAGDLNPYLLSIPTNPGSTTFELQSNRMRQHSGVDSTFADRPDLGEYGDVFSLAGSGHGGLTFYGSSNGLSSQGGTPDTFASSPRTEHEEIYLGGSPFADAAGIWVRRAFYAPRALTQVQLNARTAA